MSNKYLVGLFDDEEILMDAVKSVRKEGITIHDVVTPFPVHGLDEAMGLKESQLHTAGFIAGATGLFLALGFMSWANGINYPLNIGGKPFVAIPSFIPITFELTVLFASIAMVFAFLIRSKLFPGAQHKIYHPRLTDDLFAMTFEVNHETSKDELLKIQGILQSSGAVEVFVKEFEEE